MQLDHLSYSSISLFLNCPESWRRKYIEKEPTISSPALVFGSAFHNTIERAIESRFEGPPYPLSELWPDAWADAMGRNDDIDWGADTPEHHYNEGLRILETKDVQTLANSLTPLEDDDGLYMERRIELNVPGVPVPIIGYIDIVTDDCIPGDFKTSKYQWRQEKAQDELQTLFYLAALNQAGFDVPGLRFRHYIITKAKNPKVQVLEHAHTWDEVFWLYELIGEVWRSIEAEIFPYGPNSWLCSPKYCSFYSTCRGRGDEHTG